MHSIKRTTYKNEDFVALVKALDANLSETDGDEHDFYHQFNGIEGLNHVIVYYENEIAIGCGVIKPFDRKTVEVKRMYVKPEHQGKGIGSKILQELEKWGSSLKYTTAILETGIRQPDAIALYKKNKYSITDNYGQYIGVKNSICFKKSI
ncbi:GNAT family N-acetyltransferase [Cellulophaga baltica]|uniref:GNAT family N-acetyltransferase n=1 Tax=Cellulophaga TaxID=104264 RepID=UPI001C067316|nr:MULTISPECIES: GNAT family N-acetyltransferase [Cellulophaga]MBU2996026.1 GNAT family N-acetyltransferase [Cellulophaga baltica]MDO6767421.1 GNAT family N-acetyltransferase [Cellulophaga sp. 1_MG-2023]